MFRFTRRITVIRSEEEPPLCESTSAAESRTRFTGELKPPFPLEAQREFDAMLRGYDALKVASHTTGSDGHVDDDLLVTRLACISPQDRWWTDLRQLHECFIKRSPRSADRYALPGWRRRLHEVIGEQRYQTYAASAPDISKANDDALRLDLLNCLGTVYHFYSLYGESGGPRDTIIVGTLWSAARIILLELAVALVLFWPRPGWAFWPIVPDAVRLPLIVAMFALRSAPLCSH